MQRRTFIKGAVIAASTPTVTAFADTADNVTLSHLIELHTLAYEADTVEWRKLADLDEQQTRLATTATTAAVWYEEQLRRCMDSKTVVERMETAIFDFQLSSFGEVLMLARWVHERLDDCRCYFYQEESTVHSIFSQIARAA